jgi:23S rRNA (adenine2503-C2)-methyltransferase
VAASHKYNRTGFVFLNKLETSVPLFQKNIYIMSLPLIYDLSQSQLKSLLVGLGEPEYRIQQIWEGLYRNYWNSPDEFSTLPLSLRQALSHSISFDALTSTTTLRSSDGETIKSVFTLQDGCTIETVLMKYDPGDNSKELEQISRAKRRTICISTQVGCAMGCVFCATGQMGLKRNLSSGEIIAQVMYFARQLQNIGETVTNVVIMGMGEPFHNYKNTMEAIDRLNDPSGLNFGARRFTISTVGLVPVIEKFSLEKRQVNLAISLHAADDSLRNSLIPMNRKYGISSLLEASCDYTLESGRRITFEWALIDGVNDTAEQAHLLARRLKGLLCHVNAIPLNPINTYKGKATSKQRAKVFKDILVNAGIPCTIRQRRGIDIHAGCGQLAGKM